MGSAAEQKTGWNLGETVMWICTRDYDRVAGLWHMSEVDAVASTFFNRALLPNLEATVTISELYDSPPPACQVALQRRAEFLPTAEPNTLPSDQLLREVMRRVQIRHVQMTMIRLDGNDGERSSVSASEANDLVLRLTGDPAKPVLVWSRSRRSPVGTSPWFSRSDVLRGWPERIKKTIAVIATILRHLREISTPEAPLTKAKARERCLAEVPNAYPEAFKKAWVHLESCRKRGQGKHGPKSH